MACHDDDDDDDDDDECRKREIHIHTRARATQWAYKPFFSYSLCWMYVGLLKNHIYDPTNHALQQHNTKLHFILIQHIAAMVPKWYSVVHRLCNMTYCCNTFLVTDINTTRSLLVQKHHISSIWLCHSTNNKFLACCTQAICTSLLLWCQGTCFSHGNFQSCCVDLTKFLIMNIQIVH